MKKLKLPKTDSIQELADFWDSHDLTDLEGELEEVADPIFVRGTAISVKLGSREAQMVKQLAKRKRVSEEALVHGWVMEKLSRQRNGRRTKGLS